MVSDEVVDAGVGCTMRRILALRLHAPARQGTRHPFSAGWMPLLAAMSGCPSPPPSGSSTSTDSDEMGQVTSTGDETTTTTTETESSTTTTTATDAESSTTTTGAESSGGSTTPSTETDASTSGSEYNVCDPDPGDTECYSCTKVMCCDELQACIDTDPNCDCVLDCVDEFTMPGPTEAQMCANDCGADFLPLMAPLLAIQTCQQGTCGDVCGA